MSDVATQSIEVEGVKKGDSVLPSKNRGVLLRFELEDSVESQKLDHGLDLGLQPLQNDLAGIFWKAAKNAQQESDSRAVDKIDICHFDFGVDKRLIPKRPDLLLELGGPSRIEAGTENFKSNGSTIGLRVKKSFHTLATYIRKCDESKCGAPEMGSGVSLP
jgi:hypothetical protein